VEAQRRCICSFCLQDTDVSGDGRDGSGVEVGTGQGGQHELGHGLSWLNIF
jgi:hypothetical protein